MSLNTSDPRFASKAHAEMIASLFADQPTKQQAAIEAWKAQEAEKRARITAQAMSQPRPPSIPSRLKKTHLDKPPPPPRRPVGRAERA